MEKMFGCFNANQCTHFSFSPFQSLHWQWDGRLILRFYGLFWFRFFIQCFFNAVATATVAVISARNYLLPTLIVTVCVASVCVLTAGHASYIN